MLSKQHIQIYTLYFIINYNHKLNDFYWEKQDNIKLNIFMNKCIKRGKVQELLKYAICLVFTGLFHINISFLGALTTILKYE